MASLRIVGKAKGLTIRMENMEGGLVWQALALLTDIRLGRKILACVKDTLAYLTGVLILASNSILKLT
jgi:hypothetical protein